MSSMSQHPGHDQISSAPVSVLRTTAAVQPAPPIARLIRWLTLGAVVGPILFTLAWMILGKLSPGYTAWGIHFAPYSPISQPISGLGLGSTAPFMNAAFLLCGALLAVGAIAVFQTVQEIGAVSRWTCTVLFALTGLGMMLDGIFTLQSFFPHFVGFALGCGGAVLGFLIAGLLFRRVPRWRQFGTWLLVASPLTLALLVLSQVTFNQTAIIAGHGVAGLTERILVVEVLLWFVVLGWLAFRRS